MGLPFTINLAEDREDTSLLRLFKAELPERSRAGLSVAVAFVEASTSFFSMLKSLAVRAESSL